MPLLPPAAATAAPAPRPLNMARAGNAPLPLCRPAAGVPARAGTADGAGHAGRHRWLRSLCAALAWLVVVLGMLAPGLSQAQHVLPVPVLTARVIDQTGTLSDADKTALEAKLAAYEQSKGSQIVVLMVPTTQPEDIASYAHRVASDWKIGRRDVGDGVLLIVAKDDRRMRIEVAKTLEGALPDLAVARILDQTLRPQFRQGKYADGISAALDQIMQAIDGEGLAPAQARTAAGGSPEQEVDWTLMLVIVVMGSLVGGSLLKDFMGRFLGSVVTSVLTGGLVFMLSGFAFVAAVAGMASLFITLFADLGGNGGGGSGGGGGKRMRGRHSPIIIGSPPFGGGRGGGWDGGWGGGSGGGFSSGGGGSFGGGGASGDW